MLILCAMNGLDGVNKREAIILFLGDVVVFYVSLWLMLFLRHLMVPDRVLLEAHISPFTILFASWIVVFFIAGLYEKHTVILRSKLPTIIFYAQIVNSAIAVLFFYLIPYFGITPKTNLFIYLIVSFALVVFWRMRPYWLIGSRRREKGILIGSGEEMRELHSEVNNNERYALEFVSSIDLDEVDEIDFHEEIIKKIYSEGITTVVVDTRNEKVEPILPQLYNLMFSRVRFIDMYKVYEDIFDRVPLSLVKYSWFLENVSAKNKFTYDFLKRLMDIIISVPLLLLTAIIYPFIFVAIKLQDGGKIFYSADRVGRNNKTVRITKFRSMTGADSGEEVLNSPSSVTWVGNFLRVTRIDEFPQIWAVLKGNLSIIGPRPEFPALVRRYEKEVPYYNIRHLLKPGLSGWAQIYHDEHPHHGEDVEETKHKLSYDLYYIKNRSFLLDLKIVLKTIKTFLKRGGR